MCCSKEGNQYFLVNKISAFMFKDGQKKTKRMTIPNWMDSVTEMMGLPLEDLSDQARDRSSWRKHGC